VLVLEDIGGVALKTIIPKDGFDIDEFLEIACSISMYPPVSLCFLSLSIYVPRDFDFF
jgi:hypothetical protein